MSWPMSCGYSESEVAHQLGISRKFVVSCLGELRDELERLNE
jgi:biotin operon repressor